MRCGRCRIPYPETLLGPVRGSHNYANVSVCGICALAISNELHNQDHKGFHYGVLAATMVELAKEFRLLHPQYKPHSNQTRAHWTKTPRRQ